MIFKSTSYLISKYKGLKLAGWGIYIILFFFQKKLYI